MCVYWKIGSVIVTTLETASFFVGLAGTKVTQKCASPSRKAFKRASDQIRTLLLGFRKRSQTTAGEGDRRGCRAVGTLTQILPHLPDKQPQKKKHSQQTLEHSEKLKTASTASRSAGRPSTWVAERARATHLNSCFSPRTLDPVWPRVTKADLMQRVSRSLC